MIVAFGIIAVAIYLGFLIDWPELRNILRQGGWGAAVIYGVVAVLIYGALACPAMKTGGGMHH